MTHTTHTATLCAISALLALSACFGPVELDVAGSLGETGDGDEDPDAGETDGPGDVDPGDGDPGDGDPGDGDPGDGDGDGEPPCVPFEPAPADSWSSILAAPGPDGYLVYAADEHDNRIPDFSAAGYRRGGVALPEVPERVALGPSGGDDTAAIQAAIDEVGALPLDAEGHRGAVVLAPGEYIIEGTLELRHSGVVLRGAGRSQDPETNTILRAVGDGPHWRDVLVVGNGDHDRWSPEVPGTRTDVISDHVPVGSFELEVADPDNFVVGDHVVVVHPCTAAWLEAVDWGGTAGEPDWEPGSLPLVFKRQITAIEGATLRFDAPIFNHLDRGLSQSHVYLADREELVTEVGVEQLRVDIETAGGSDEDHAWNGIVLRGVEDAWVRRVTVKHFGHAGISVQTGVQITVDDVRSVDPVAEVTGGRMYNFEVSGAQQVLFTDCYARGGRHHYVSNGTTYVSGVVFHRSISEAAQAPSEGHRRWSMGLLYDNVREIDPVSDRVLGLYNRGSMGSSHGWAAAHSVAWNYDLGEGHAIIQRPPTGQNYAIGGLGLFTGDSPKAPFDQPEGWVEGSDEPNLYPSSLYEHQLGERLCPVGASTPSNAAHPFGRHDFAYTAGTASPSAPQAQLDASVAAAYDAWKADYLEPGCGPGQVQVHADVDPDNLTVSEAHGYGMLLTVLMAGHDPEARAVFDGLFAYFRAHPSNHSDDLMAWYQDRECADAHGPSSASDGDIDIAQALLLADKQWGSCGAIDYRGEAAKVIAAIAEHELDAGRDYVLLGDWASPASPGYHDATRTSDFITDHFRSFAAATGDPSWLGLVDSIYATVASVQAEHSPATGLLPDFVVSPIDDPTPAPADFLEGDHDGAYHYNACRDPWRLATDYLIAGDPRAKTAARKISEFLAAQTGGDPSQIRAGYGLDGAPSPGSNYLSMAFVAPVGPAAMVSGDQGWLDAIWALSAAAGSEGYYEDTLRLLSMLVMSGNWWAPEQALAVCN